MFEHAYIAARGIDTSGDENRNGGPQLPDTWGVQRQTNTGVWMITHPLGALMFCYRANAEVAVGLWAIAGDPDVLAELAAARADVMPLAEAWRRKGDAAVGPGASYSPRRMIRAWRAWHCDVVEDVDGVPVAQGDVVRTLVSEGELIPAAIIDGAPGVVGPRTVSALHRPAMSLTLRGHAIHAATENEPDRGP